MRSLRARLLVWTVGGMALLVAVFGVVVYGVMRQSLNRSFNASLAGVARTIGATVKQEGGQVEAEFDDRDIPAFRHPKHPDYFELWGEGRRVVQRSASLGQKDLEWCEGDAGEPRFDDVRLPHGRDGRMVTLAFQVKADPEEQAKQGGLAPAPVTVTLAVARETAPLNADLEFLARLLASATAGAGLLALLVAAIVVRQGLAPLGALAGRIGAIREDNLATRIPLDGMPTEMEPIGRRLNDLLLRLEEVFRRERAFTADAAHELRTPLAGIRSTMEVALSRLRKPDEYQQALGDCLTITRQMQSMVDNLLALSRLEGGQTALQPEPVRLAELIEKCWGPLAAAVEARRIACRFDVPADLVCTADRANLARVLSNLLANAADYTDDGGRIEIVAIAACDAVGLKISNTGCRLSQDEVAHVFERFWRGDSARAATGVHCGLGLALVQRAVTAFGGTVDVGVAGGLFAVRVRLPAAKA
jgi:signal transduction histidine kinase